MENILFIVLFIIIAFGVGFAVGKRPPKNDGFIYLEKNEDGDDRIRFYLGMEYDDISSHEFIVFKVVRENGI